MKQIFKPQTEWLPPQDFPNLLKYNVRRPRFGLRSASTSASSEYFFLQAEINACSIAENNTGSQRKIPVSKQL